MVAEILLFFQANTEISETPYSAEFLAILALIVAFAIEIGRRVFQRSMDKRDRKLKAIEDKAERDINEAKAGQERQQLADKVHAELALHYEREAFKQDKNAWTIRQELERYHERESAIRLKEAAIFLNKITEQDQTVKDIDKKVVTLKVADQHKVELKTAIEENTRQTIENTEKTIEGIKEAHAAFEVANTIGDKLEAQGKAGLLNQAQKEPAEDIEKIETDSKETPADK